VQPLANEPKLSERGAAGAMRRGIGASACTRQQSERSAHLPAQRARGRHMQPVIDAGRVHDVAARRQQPHGLPRLKPLKAAAAAA